MQHLIAKPCRYSSIEDAEMDLMPDDDSEEDPGLWNEYSAVVRTTSGEAMKITIAPFADDEPRLVGRAGLASQIVRRRR